MKTSTLEMLRRLYDLQLAQAQSEAQQARDELERCLAQIDSLQSEAAELERMLARDASQGVSPAQLLMGQYQREIARRRVDEAHALAQTHRESVRQAQVRVDEANRQCKTHGRIEERFAEAVRQQDTRAAQKLLDEVASRKAAMDLHQGGD